MSYSNKKKGNFTASALTLIAAAVAVPAYAADGDSVQDLDQRVRILERQLEIQKEEAEAKAKDAAVVTVGEKGFSLKSAKGDYELQFRGLIQADARFFNGDNAGVGVTPGRLNDQFLLRRVEPTISGSLGKLVGFQITPQFGGDAPALLDFWGELRFDPAFNVRAGRFKQPVGLENLQSSPALTFIERALPTSLVPSRDNGVQLHGQVLGQTVSYAVGIFNGGADGGDAATPDGDNRHDIAARIFAEPFKNSPGILQNFGVGIAGTTGNAYGLANTVSVVKGYKSVAQNQFFAYRAATNAIGKHTHLTPQAYWYNSNYGILAEYVISRQELVNTTNRQSVSHKAYQVAANYVLTGEDAGFKGVKPKSPFKIGGDGWGAFEIAARTSALTLDSDTFTGAGATSFADPNAAARKAQEYGIAANWYLTNNAKIAINYEATRFDGGAALGTDRANERAILARLQLSY